jgi:lysophospholipase L1-like esterase
MVLGPAGFWPAGTTMVAWRSVQFRFGSAVLALCMGAWATDGLAATPAPGNVVVIGDSITAGAGASRPETTYVNDLGALFGSGTKMQGFGKGGATLIPTSKPPFLPYIQQAEYTAATNAVSALGASTDLAIIIMLGTNDSSPENWSGTGPAAYATAYAAMVDHFLSLAPRARIYPALPPALFETGRNRNCVLQNELDPIIRQLAMEKSLTVIDVYGATTGHPEYFTTSSGAFDIHPNDVGHQAIAQVMYRTILGQASNGGTDTGGACDGGAVLPKLDAGPVPADGNTSQPPVDSGTPQPPLDSGASQPSTDTGTSQPPADGGVSPPPPDGQGGAGGSDGTMRPKYATPSGGGCAIAHGASSPYAWCLGCLALLARRSTRSRRAGRIAKASKTS